MMLIAITAITAMTTTTDTIGHTSDTLIAAGIIAAIGADCRTRRFGVPHRFQ